MVRDVVDHNDVESGLAKIFGQSIAGTILDAVCHAVACRDSGGTVDRAGQLQDGAF
jgi:hypothetical protein